MKLGALVCHHAEREAVNKSLRQEYGAPVVCGDLRCYSLNANADDSAVT